jgi:hypothetical protein
MKAHVVSYITILLVSVVLTANGQGIRPGVEAGINFQNLNGKSQNGDKLTNKLMPGFHGGVNVLIPIAPEIYFQPGLLFSVKGASSDLIGIPHDLKIKLNYLELPLNLLYRGQLGDNFVLLGFGPYAGYAISGKTIVNDVKEKIRFENSVGSGASGTYMRAFDAGANIFAGYELSGGLFFTLNAQLGLININPDYTSIADDKSMLKNTGFGVSVGYRF